MQIVTYNRPELLLEALWQVDLQDYDGEISVEILDDSLVSSLKAVEAFESTRGLEIKYRWLKERLSIGQKRNLLLREATKEVICTWDDDDIYSCDRVRLQVQALQSCNCATMERRYFYWSSRRALRACGLVERSLTGLMMP